MSVFKWSTKYSVGIDALDNQHKKLFEIVESLCLSMAEGVDRVAIKCTLQALAKYVKQHFETEEKMLEKAAYIHLSQHKQQHAKLISDVNDFIVAFNNKNHSKIMELPSFLRKWLVEHIAEFDKKYSQCLRQHTSAGAA